MDKSEIESQSRLLIELGEPETWLEAMWRASRREALHSAATGNEELAKRWRKLEKALDYASAAISADPLTDETPSPMQGDTAQPIGDA